MIEPIIAVAGGHRAHPTGRDFPRPDQQSFRFASSKRDFGRRRPSRDLGNKVLTRQGNGGSCIAPFFETVTSSSLLTSSSPAVTIAKSSESIPTDLGGGRGAGSQGAAFDGAEFDGAAWIAPHPISLPSLAPLPLALPPIASPPIASPPMAPLPLALPLPPLALIPPLLPLHQGRRGRRRLLASCRVLVLSISSLPV